MDPSDLLQGKSRETQIRRDARGRWFNGADPITHPLLTRAFDAWVARAEDGRYCLKNDINWAYITLEGPPLFVRSAELVEGQVLLSLSDGSTEPLDPGTLWQGSDGALYCRARGGSLAARFDSHAVAQLEACVGEDEQGVFLELGGSRHRPPVRD